MAKTWTVKEAFEAIVANDSSAIADFGKRFPLATVALSRSGENDGLKILMGAMPERVTMRVLEASLKDGVEVSDGDDDAEQEAPKKPEKKTEKVEKPKKEAAKAKPKKEVAPEPEEDDDEDAEETDAPDYTKMSAIELYKECKKRGIKVEPKQKSKVYIDALKAADAESEEDDDDFEDDEEEETPKKSAKKSAPAKKAAKNDEDDEWDI